jgi:hypothetical protein
MSAQVHGGCSRQHVDLPRALPLIGRRIPKVDPLLKGRGTDLPLLYEIVDRAAK